MVTTVPLRFFPALVVAVVTSWHLTAQDTSIVVNDISRLNPITVGSVIKPVTTGEIAAAVRNHSGKISIGGGYYSMGGQSALENSLHIDMRDFDSIVYFSPREKVITVQAGITWREIQEFIDSCDLSVKIMQTYSNFTVGGSLSVNAHGRYMGLGPIVSSVRQIRMVLAGGDTITANPSRNAEIFYGAIGGYGGLGVIAEVSLDLANNVKVERKDKVFAIGNYKEHFFQHIRNDPSVIFHNADIYPNRYKKVRAVSYVTTDKDVTVRHRLKPMGKKYRFNRFAIRVVSGFPGGKWMRQHFIDPVLYAGHRVEWRNYEASYNVLELEPRSRERSTYVLQEYFVPAEHFDRFYPLLITILKEHKVNVLNISIRHSREDPGTLMAWAREEVFAFVVYYKQGTRDGDKAGVRVWTQKLVDAALSCNGTYYLPYQIHATPEQFFKAYPKAVQFLELKKQLDPQDKFSNRLWNMYANPF